MLFRKRDSVEQRANVVRRISRARAGRQVASSPLVPDRGEAKERGKGGGEKKAVATVVGRKKLRCPRCAGPRSCKKSKSRDVPLSFWRARARAPSPSRASSLHRRTAARVQRIAASSPRCRSARTQRNTSTPASARRATRRQPNRTGGRSEGGQSGSRRGATQPSAPSRRLGLERGARGHFGKRTESALGECAGRSQTRTRPLRPTTTPSRECQLYCRLMEEKERVLWYLLGQVKMATKNGGHPMDDKFIQGTATDQRLAPCPGCSS